MKLKIVSVGGRMPDWVEMGFQDFSRRIQPLLKMELIEVPLAKRSKTSDVNKIKAEEAVAIKKRLRGDEKIIALDVKGKPFGTHDLASYIESWKMSGQDVALLIGGPDGLDASLLTDVQKLSLSKLTLPHPLVRLVVVEQIYRALSINNNHPYHRE